MKDYQVYKSDNLLGFQEAKPVFVKRSFNSFGKTWKPGEEFNWIVQPCRAQDWDSVRKRVELFYLKGFIHHDSRREVQQKVGDRLGELSSEKLIHLVRQLNSIVKKRVTTEKEFQDKRIKQSKIADKQRGIIRAWLYRNEWAREEFVKLRDYTINQTTVTPAAPEETEEPQET